MTTHTYIGSTSWDDDSKDAEKSWVLVHAETNCDLGGREIRYVEAEADTGSRYVVVVTPLGPAGRVGLGGPALVTVCHPWTDAWALQTSGLLTSKYVAEHFTGGRWQSGKINGGDVAALTKTIAHAMSRPYALNI